MRTLFLILAILGVIISVAWVISSGFSYEPILVFITSILALVGVFINDSRSEEGIEKSSISPENTQNVNVNVSYGSNGSSQSNEGKGSEISRKTSNIGNDDIIEIMKTKVNILFIDDDKKFKVVKILKDSGWRNTKWVEDVSNLDDELIKKSQIFFVDIHGVGAELECPNEGLDLALMLKKKYPSTKVIIYSANRKNDIFHEAIKKADYILEKNALLYDFQSLVESYSIEFYNKNKDL